MELIKRIKDAENQAKDIVAQAKQTIAQQKNDFAKNADLQKIEAKKQRLLQIEQAQKVAQEQGQKDVDLLTHQAQQTEQQLNQKISPKVEPAVQKVIDFLKG